jgi:hypothetical protein
MGQTKVLYIAGSNRCGSTLLARLLGDLPKFFAIGEGIVHFSCGTSEEHVPCGCGLPVLDCSFWNGISIPSERNQFGARWLRLRRAPWLLSYCRRHPRQTSELMNSLGNFYAAIAERAGAEVIVDSSKNPLHARFLSLVPNIDLYVVYLVRDPRSVVASSCQPKEWLPGTSALHATARWISLTLGCEYVRTWVPRWRLLRYEDFVKAPGRTTLEIAADVGYTLAESPFINESMAKLGPQHMLGSNPDKLKRGPTRIAEKSTHLSWLNRASVSMLTAPLLWKYGYWSGGRRSRSQAVAPGEIAVLPEIIEQGTELDLQN